MISSIVQKWMINIANDYKTNIEKPHGKNTSDKHSFYASSSCRGKHIGLTKIVRIITRPILYQVSATIHNISVSSSSPATYESIT
jgi:hypothetical protein